MYKRQLTWQKILCFAALAVSALGLAAYHWICQKHKTVRQTG